jgi:Flp pilus assembly protein TadD
MSIVRREYWISLALVVATLAAYWQVGRNGFVDYDDREYVTQNRMVQAGLTLEGTAWAFTTGHAANWHPLTWLSHMADCELFGLNPGAHHRVSLLIHAANALLLLSLFLKMTGELWPSAFVAGVFALHPLHVESVAWIAERKDVLSTLLGLLTLLAYLRYVERPVFRRYLPALLLFLLALLAKPMLVTLPFVLLLLDFWPLRRLQAPSSGAGPKHPTRKKPIVAGRRKSASGLLWEKVPFLVLSAAASVATILVQRAGGAIMPVQRLPLVARFENALLSYVRYLGKMAWPDRLAVFYPYPQELPAWQVAAAVLFLAGMSVAAGRLARRHPYLAVGWFWYVGMLVPVIGLVQVGLQSMADRYTYLPMVGTSVVVAWGAPALISRWRTGRAVLRIAAPAIPVLCGAISWHQVGFWRDSSALFTHAQDATGDNFVALNGLGSLKAAGGDYSGALGYYREAVRINPGYAEARSNLGIAYYKLGRLDEAIQAYRDALQSSPDYAEAHYNLGVALLATGRVDDAIGAYQAAMRSNPRHAAARYNLSLALESAGRTQEAMEQYYETIRISPDFAEAHNNLGILLFDQGRIAEAIVQFSTAVRLKPGLANARRNLEVALARQAQSTPHP